MKEYLRHLDEEISPIRNAFLFDPFKRCFSFCLPNSEQFGWRQVSWIALLDNSPLEMPILLVFFRSPHAIHHQQNQRIFRLRRCAFSTAAQDSYIRCFIARLNHIPFTLTLGTFK